MRARVATCCIRVRACASGGCELELARVQAEHERRMQVPILKQITQITRPHSNGQSRLCPCVQALTELQTPLTPHKQGSFLAQLRGRRLNASNAS